MEEHSSGQTNSRFASDLAITLVVQIQPVPGTNGIRFREALEKCYDAVSSIARRYGGRSEWLDEERILCIFSSGMMASGQWIDAAFHMMEQLTALNQNYLTVARTPIRVGIGANSGPGSARPAEKAAVLSKLNQQTPFPTIFVSAETMEVLEPAASQYYVEPLEATSSETPVYALFPAQTVP